LEYLESIYDEIVEFQRTRRFDIMYMQTKEVGCKENCGIKTISIEDCKGNIIVDKRQVLTI